HKLVINGYEVGHGSDEIQTFSVDEKAFFVMDERYTQIAPFDRQFASKSVGQRAMQLFAGPLMNFLLAILLFIIIGLVQGIPAEKAIIGEVVPDSAAEKAGIVAGDEIVKMDDDSITSWIE